METYNPIPGYVEVRLRENIHEVTVTDPEPATLYEYDEYIFHVENRAGLETEITKNRADWIATARAIEVDQRATPLVEVEEKSASRISTLSTAGLTQVKLYCEKTGEAPSADSGVFTPGADPWEVGKSYEKNDLFSYNGNMGYVKQQHTSQAQWLPFAQGTESLYGARPAPDEDGIYPYVYNMAATVGMKVRDPDDGQVYECIQAISDMLYKPHEIPAHFSATE